jgi:hypothetical protein
MMAAVYIMYLCRVWTAIMLPTYDTIALRPPNTIESSAQAILKSADYQFRDALREDIDDITTVALDAFSPSLAWQYTMPEYQRYKDYTRYCTREGLARQWDDIDRDDTVFIKVVAVPDAMASDGRNERVVAVSACALLARNGTATSATQFFAQMSQHCSPTLGVRMDASDSSSMYNCSAELDTNQTRATDLDCQLGAAATQYIDDAYPKYLYLASLATHPDWDGYGFAALSLHWGTKLANTLEEPVTLIATPAGYPLYNDFGFRSLKNVSIKTLDGWEGGSLWFELMEYS